MCGVEAGETVKFNLKNRPHCYLDDIDKFDEWFEGFEKELREIISGKKQPEGTFAKGMCKEILGE